MKIPINIRINKWIANLALVGVVIGLIIGVFSLTNDPFKGIESYSQASLESKKVVSTNFTNIENVMFTKITNNSKPQTNTLKYKLVTIDNNKPEKLILEYKSNNETPKVNEKSYIELNDLRVNQFEKDIITKELKIDANTVFVKYKSADTIANSNFIGWVVAGGSFLIFVFYQFRYWYYAKDLKETVGYINATTDNQYKDSEWTMNINPVVKK